MDVGKKILVVLADYVPLITSNTNCIEPYLKGLEKKGYHIDILTRRMRCQDSFIEVLGSGRKIFRIDDNRVIRSIKCKEIEKRYKKGILGVCVRTYSVCVRAIFYILYSLFTYETYAKGWDIRKIKKAFKIISRKYHYDFILSVSFPERTQEVAKLYAEKYDTRTKWLLLEFDPFCYNKSNYLQIYFRHMFRVQKENYDTCYKILLTPQLYSFYMKTPFRKFHRKMYKLEYANLQPVEIHADKANKKINISKDTVSLFFCGTIKKDVRPVKRLLKTMDYVQGGTTLYIMTGSRLDEWRTEIRALGNKLVVFGQQSLDTAYLCMRDADFLVNIGNTVEYQIPGKLFEYMSFGKPIIHFANMKNDGCKNYLKYYPCSLCIDIDTDYRKAGEKIRAFIEQNRGVKHEFGFIKKKMSSLDCDKIVGDLAQALDGEEEKQDIMRL